MSILVDKDTRLLVQGITGNEGTFHARAMLAYGTPEAVSIAEIPVSTLRAYAAAGHFASGSMGPKVEAVCRFVEATGHVAVNFL
jgi:carbamate kinase